MSQTKPNIICRNLKPTDDICATEQISLACKKVNAAQYLGKEELQEKIAWLEQRIAEKKANPEKFKTSSKPSRYSATIAEIDGKIVGYTVHHTLSEEEKVIPETKTELDAIYVLPEYQSKGVGFALWQTLTEKLRQRGETVLQLATETLGPEDTHGKRKPGNVNAMKFYKRQGCIFLDKTREWKSETGIPKSKLAVQQYLLKRLDR